MVSGICYKTSDDCDDSDDSQVVATTGEEHLGNTAVAQDLILANPPYVPSMGRALGMLHFVQPPKRSGIFVLAFFSS